MKAAIELRIHSRGWDANSKRWKVDLLNGEIVASHVEVTNPWTKQQQREARWYLEQYTSVDPYAVTRAKEVGATISHYAASIARELGLDSVISVVERVKLNKNQPPVVLLVVTEDQNDQVELNTIQQLHWELLEDSTRWTRDAYQIHVKRVLSSSVEPSHSINRVKTWPEHGAFSTINVLIVVARDITTNPAIYNDVSPTMVLNILLRLQKKVAHGVRINIEVARPATFVGFANHLADTEQRHGPGYFHLVHFDMHGSVSLKTRTANLFFNDSSGPALSPVPAREIAELLGKAHVPFVVLNACESARANSGDDANIAYIFRSYGVKEVLAMSFKISSSATELFLQQFYHALLEDGQSFADASATARQILKTSSKRKARFELERDLIDWFVPVVYSAETDSSLVCSKVLDHDGVQQASGSTDSGTDDYKSYSTRLVGREFDLVRLEHFLEKGKAIYLCGLAGVGKTELLHYARYVWSVTNYVQSISYIDFSKTRIASVEEVYTEILTQLQVFVDDQMPPKTAEITYDSMMTQLVNYLERARCLLVFDGLQVFHRMVQEMEKRPEIANVWRLISDLMSFAAKQLPSNTYIIMSGRSFDFDLLSKEYISFELEKGRNIFELPGLELADATELSLRILNDSGYETAHFRRAELDELEHVIKAVQGNPDSLIRFLPALQRMDVAWNGSHDFLLFGDQHLASVLASDDDPPIIWREMREWGERLREDMIPCVMYLGEFWHEAPIASSFVTAMTEMKIVQNSELAEAAYYFAEAVGLITCQHRSMVFVHPQFTLFARHVWHRSQLYAANGLDDYSKTWALKTIAMPAVYKTEEIKQASSTIIKPSSSVATEQESPGIGLLKYFNMLSEQQSLTIALNAWFGQDYAEMAVDYPRSFRNILCCIQACQLSREVLSVTQWPLDYLAYAATAIRMAVSTAEAALFAQRFEDLLTTFLDCVGGKALPPKLRDFALIVLNYLAATYEAEVHLPSPRRKAFSQMAIDITEASEDKYGPAQDSQSIYNQGYAFRYMACSALSENDVGSARKFWQRCLDNDAAWLAAADKEDSESVQDDAQPEEAALRVVREKGRTMDRSIGRAYVTMRREALSQLLQAIGNQIQAGTENNLSSQVLDAAGQQGYFLEHCYDSLENSGLTGQMKFARWWPTNFDTVAWMAQSQTPKARLSALEAAEDAGDSVEAIRQHTSLMGSAITSARFADVEGHLTAIKRHQLTDKASLSNSPSTTDSLENVEMTIQLLKVLDEGNDDKAPTTADAAKFLEKIFQSIQENNPALAKSIEPGIKRWSEAASNGEDPSEMEDILVKSKLAYSRLKNYLRTSGGKHSIAEIAEAESAVRGCWLRAHEVEDSNDMESALTALAELDGYLSSDLHGAFIDTDALEAAHVLYRERLNLRQNLAAWAQAIDEDAYDKALQMLQEASEKCSEPHPNLIEAYKMTESLIWQASYRAIVSSVSDSEPAAAIVACEQLLKRALSGDFVHISEDDLAPGVRAVESIRLKAMAARDFENMEWDAVIATAEEWLEFHREVSLIDPRAADYGRDLLDAARYHKLSFLIAESDHDMRYDEAQEHHDAMQELHNRVHASPEVVRVLTPKINQDQLTEYNTQLAVRKQVMNMLGPEHGATFIRTMRQAMEYVNPLEALKAVEAKAVDE